LSRAALVLALVLAGCGASGEDPVPAQTSAPEAEVEAVRITDPDAGARVRGRFVAASRVGGRVTVAGTASPRATVLVSGGCTARNCRTIVRAQDDGNWTAAVRVEARVRRPVATVQAQDPAGELGDELRVRLRVPERPPAESEAPLPEAEPAATPAGPAPRALVMVGDSLAQGTEPFLPGLLDGWTVVQDARRGRPLAEGMRVLTGVPIPDGPVVLAFSLFSNDDPGAVEALEQAVRRSVALAGEDGCAIWATIFRPPLNGVSYRAANARLEALTFDPELAGRLLLVPWADAVAARPAWIAGDGVHGTPEGYRGRAQMYADAARSCGS
jgi:hypothetical protein